MSDIPKPLLIALRIVFGACGIFIAVKYFSQIPSGVIEWTSGESDLPELTYHYRANTPGALLAAVVGFGGFVFGFLAFAVYSTAVLRIKWLLPWVVVSMGGLIMLKRLSQFTGISAL